MAKDGWYVRMVVRLLTWMQRVVDRWYDEQERKHGR
jgi:hypothetical protein